MQKKKKYDTNPLDKRVAERAEAEMGAVEPPVDTEGPTRPMEPVSGEEDQHWPPADQPRSTSQVNTPPSTPVGAVTHGRYAPHSGYMPPNPQQGQWVPPHAGSIQPGEMPPHQGMPPGYGQRPGPRGSAQYGLKPNFAAMLCYTPFVGVIASILLNMYEPPESRFVCFHAKQSLFAHIGFWAISIAFSLAGAVAPVPLKYLLLLPQSLFYIGAVAGFVAMMVKSYRGEATKIPLIGDQVE